MGSLKLDILLGALPVLNYFSVPQSANIAIIILALADKIPDLKEG